MEEVIIVFLGGVIWAIAAGAGVAWARDDEAKVIRSERWPWMYMSYAKEGAIGAFAAAVGLWTLLLAGAFYAFMFVLGPGMIYSGLTSAGPTTLGRVALILGGALIASVFTFGNLVFIKQWWDEQRDNDRHVKSHQREQVLAANLPDPTKLIPTKHPASPPLTSNYELRDRDSRVGELEEICSDLRSENASSREHIRFLEETNASLHKLNDELFSELDELGEQVRSREMKSLTENQRQGEKEEFLVEPETHSVRLVDVGLRKVSVIKAIREVTDAGLKETKELVEAAPVVVAVDLSPGVAMGLVAAIEKSGARAEVCG